MAKRYLPEILLGLSLAAAGTTIWGMNNLPNSQSLPRPERPAIVSRVLSLDDAAQRTKAQDSTNTRVITYYRHQRDSLLSSPEYTSEKTQYTADSTRYVTERAAQQSAENVKLSGIGAILGLGILSGLMGGIMIYTRAGRN
jgi:hypothetical protein